MYDGQMSFQCIIINDLNLLSLFQTFNGEYAFRGQSNIDWKLKTSFERFMESNPTSRPHHEIEAKIISTFERQVHQYLQKIGIEFDKLDINDKRAVIQHYGGPTRMLDVTKSFINALAFALIENSTNASAVYCFRRIITEVNSDASDYLRDILLKLSATGQVAPGVEIPEQTNPDKIIKTYFPQKPCFRNMFQSGFFLVPGVVDIPFEKVLANNLGVEAISFEKETYFSCIEKLKQKEICEELLSKATIIKVIIPSELKVAARKFVFKEVSMINLYPDIYGVVQSLKQIDTKSLM